MWTGPLFLSICVISVFSWFAVAQWAEARRREREAYYRSEVLKKLAESSGAGGEVSLEIMREQHRIENTRRREGLRIGGLITFAVGIGLVVFLHGLIPNEPVYMCGLIPLLVGIALGASSFLVSRE
ncbi:MAG: hypothetical protein JO061_12955 [Acidobacteriaceae bacterium]|nr:hypothetical protein [Acidobacteriaceae bacterium]